MGRQQMKEKLAYYKGIVEGRGIAVNGTTPPKPTQIENKLDEVLKNVDALKEMAACLLNVVGSMKQSSGHKNIKKIEKNG